MDKPNLDIKSRKDPLTAGLSDYLKNPANFEEVQKIIFNSFQTTCSHSSPAEMAVCPKCTEKMLVRRKTLKKLGFKNPAQYMQWQKIHATIKQKYPLVDWSKLNEERRLELLKSK